MKKQDCSVFLEEVLTAGRPLSAPAAEHVQNCPECAALREMTERFTGAGELPEVPEVLDRAVLAYAGQERRRRSFHQLFFRRIVPVAAAAAAAVVCVVALLPEPDAPGSEYTEMDIAAAAAISVTEWNTLETEAVALNYELTSCQQALSAELLSPM